LNVSTQRFVSLTGYFHIPLCLAFCLVFKGQNQTNILESKNYLSIFAIAVFGDSINITSLALTVNNFFKKCFCKFVTLACSDE
jgi:hypothetical protein